MQVSDEDTDQEQRITAVYVKPPSLDPRPSATRQLAVPGPRRYEALRRDVSSRSAAAPQFARVRVVGRYLSHILSERHDAVEVGKSFDMGARSIDLEDPYLDPYQARIVPQKLGFSVEDLASKNGIFVLLRHTVRVQDGDSFRLGHQLVVLRRSEHPARKAAWGYLERMLTPEVPSLTQPVADQEVLIGRDAGLMRLTDDPYVSRAHCRLLHKQDSVLLEDLKSSNGTYLRLRGHAFLPYGSVLLAGQTIWRVDVA